jgi:hypothetical protein
MTAATALPTAERLERGWSAYSIDGHLGIWRLSVNYKGHPLPTGEVRASLNGQSRWFNKDQGLTEKLSCCVLGYGTSPDQWLVCGEPRPNVCLAQWEGSHLGVRCIGCLTERRARPAPNRSGDVLAESSR